MKIIVDIMGGDNAPLAPLQGAAEAVAEYGVQILAVGDEKVIADTAAKNGVAMDGIEVVHAPDALSMHDDATDILKKRPDSSMAVAMRLLADGTGDALVSAGSTGALLVGATLIVKRIRGIKRAGLGTVMPGSQKPYILLDSGANVECRPEMLVQFAAMGSAYMEKVLDVKNPTVGLANNGTEDTKGTDLQLAAYPLLQSSGLNFTGNIEARDIPSGACDVVVADGFTGNIILKLTEGVAKMFSGMIKTMFYKNGKTKLAGALMKPELAEFKRSFDYTEYGGAPFLGIKKPVIKAHGSSNAKAIKNAIRQARTCAEKDVAGAIEQWMAANKARLGKTEDAQ